MESLITIGVPLLVLAVAVIVIGPKKCLHAFKVTLRELDEKSHAWDEHAKHLAKKDFPYN